MAAKRGSPRRKRRVVPKRTPHRIEGLPSRLRLVIESYGAVSATAKAIDRSEGALRKWLKGLTEPTASDLRALCKLTSTSADWLLFAEDKPAFQLTVVASDPDEHVKR